MMEMFWIAWFAFCIGVVAAALILLSNWCEAKRTEKIAKMVQDAMPAYMDELSKWTKNMIKDTTEEMVNMTKKMQESEFNN